MKTDDRGQRTDDGGRKPLAILQGDALAVLRTLPAQSVHCCVTSPPYWGLRDYGVEGQMGLEKTPEEYVAGMVSVFSQVRRVLRDDGTLWLNLGDSYNGYMANQRGTGLEAKRQHARKYIEPGAGLRTLTLKSKDLIGIPWRVAFALQADGWYLRSDIIWAKRNCMPESVLDRPTRSHEYIFLLSKSAKYFYDHEAIKEPCSESTEARLSQDIEHQQGTTRANGGAKTNGPMKAVGQRADKQRGHSRRHDGFNDKWDNMERTEQCTGMRNKRDVWTVAPARYKEAHFATFSPELIKPCILAGSRPEGTVLDPFAGSGTTGQVALELGRNALLIELNPEYVKLIRQRCSVTQGLPL